MLEWNVFGRGFDSRRLHQISPPAKFGVLSLPKGKTQDPYSPPAKFGVLSLPKGKTQDPYSPPAKFGVLSLPVVSSPNLPKGKFGVLSLLAVSLPNPPVVSLPNPPAVSTPNPTNGNYNILLSYQILKITDTWLSENGTSILFLHPKMF